jgi:ferredoxin-NADP reductase
VRALLEDSRVVPGETTILLRGTDESQRYLWNEMKALAAARGANLYTSVGRRPNDRDSWLSGRDVERGVTLNAAFPDLADSDLYVCGPQAWTDVVVAEAKATGLPAHQIHMERFDW